MITDSAKLPFSISLTTLLAGIIHASTGGDRLALVLLFSTAAAALVVGLAMLSTRGVDASSPVGAPAPVASPLPTSALPFGLALSLASCLLGLVVGPQLFVLGLVATLTLGVIWFATTLYARSAESTHIGSELSSRVVQPVEYPLVALGLMALIVIAVSRILLSVDKDLAVVIAIVVAAVVFGFAWLVNGAKISRPVLWGGLGLTLVALLGAGALAAGQGERAFHPEHETEPIKIVAQGTAFTAKEVSGVIDQTDSKVFIRFFNEDQEIRHNLALFSDSGYTHRIATGAVFKGSDRGSEDIVAGPLKAGTYYFKCDMHASMIGEITLTAAEAEGE